MNTIPVANLTRLWSLTCPAPPEYILSKNLILRTHHVAFEFESMIEYECLAGYKLSSPANLKINW